LAKGIGLSVIAHDPAIAPQAAVWARYGVRPVTLPELAASADIVSLHVPLVAATYHLFGAALLGQMKPDAVLINTSRGGVVDEQALAAALKTGALAGAALDVFECEPLKAIDLFDGIGNLIFTPHVAGVTQESNLRISKMIAHAVLDHLSGTDGYGA
jgi:(S)-sulfolactate dehydrogenase